MMKRGWILCDFFNYNKIVRCEESHDKKHKSEDSKYGEKRSNELYEESSMNNNDSLIDMIKNIPINPFIDKNENMNKYKYGVEKKNIERYTGVNVYDEVDEKDEKKNKPVEYPFAISNKIIFKKNNNNNNNNKTSSSNNQINTNYSNISSELYPEEGYKTPNKTKHFYADWERLLAYNHGLYTLKNANNNNTIINRDLHSLNTENDIRNKLNLYIDRINIDNPNDTCKYLGIEEYKCLLTHSFHMNTNVSNQKCVKWFNEYIQCKWDEQKLNFGYNYIENKRHKKSKAYIAAPDYQYA
ncbi:hypothetical protein CYL21_0748 [Plasmodium falciparum NF54]|uniref:ATP synthase-associated protein, putative n=2 Tax=Plasmodium falciparum TaxID=5833 RepID=Q8IHT7_PLAF7|nr:ATP synthase-associated protein, putative [Plasmodium falciparum 3D7]KAF4331238.1 hypothetical protein CYL21_0748 [Plasmodium falciparum NF54]PKC49074.1 hypothetical protein CK202_1027 [Plasmodium falciparum NF54]CZT99091.1 ATP synthase-associated protein, putative [Plasmodium falciparum 3D7]|eukprot:XP_001348109.1 conserved Plasmodium protein, unknown function [Plasmodium falciparum 3D7]